MKKPMKTEDLFNLEMDKATYSGIKSPEPNDGTFIEKNQKDSFTSEGTVRYGEETDVDDI